MRFAEIAMFVLPFGVFVAWRLLAPTMGPPRNLVIAVTGTVVAMAGLLLVLWYEEAAPPGTGYVPARLEDGRVVPSRVEPVAPKRADSVPPAQVSPASPVRQ
ncbi:MAG: DUF6111 family protein [Acetobacteraceae bacterium]